MTIDKNLNIKIMNILIEMGFHSATFGVVVCKHDENIEAILKLIAAEYEIQEDGFVITLHDDLIPVYGFLSLKSTDGRTRILVRVLTSLELNYRGDINITISNCYCCHYMIHLGSVGDDQHDMELTFPDGTMNCFMQWKQTLINSDRLDANSRFQLVGNCCS